MSESSRTLASQTRIASMGIIIIPRFPARRWSSWSIEVFRPVGRELSKREKICFFLLNDLQNTVQLSLHGWSAGISSSGDEPDARGGKIA